MRKNIFCGLMIVMTAVCGWAENNYRSVGYGSSAALAVGSSTCTMAISSDAVFSSTLPLNIGVGDCIVYDSDNGGSLDAIAFICARLSPTTYSVCDAIGDDAAMTSGATQTWRIHRAYVSLDDAARGHENPGLDDFTGRNFDTFDENRVLNTFWYIACYADAPNTDTADFGGWSANPPQVRLNIFTPSSTSGMVHEVGISQRHNGVWSVGAFTMVVGEEDGLRVMKNTTVEGIQFESGANTYSTAAVIGGSFSSDVEIHITRCIFKGPAGSGNGIAQGIKMTASNAGDVKVWNNIFYDYNTEGEGSGAIYANSTASNFNIYFYNNTIVGSYNAIWMNNMAAMTLKNCIVADNYSSTIFYGNFTGASTNNICDGSVYPPGTNAQSGEVAFADSTGKDFHLAPTDVNACNQGVDPSDADLAFSDDIDGQERIYAEWDIGADELDMQPTYTVTMTPTVTLSRTITPTATRTPVVTPAAVNDPGAGIAYPNPVKGGVVTFACRPDPGERISVRVYSAAYRQVWSTVCEGAPGQINRIEWNIHEIPPGVYLYQIQTGSRKSSFKKLAIVK